MPFVFGFDSLPKHPTKRRKVIHLPDMTRNVRHSYEEPDVPDDDTAEPSNATEKSEESLRCPLEDETVIRTSDREELIQYIKRGQRPTWVPKPGLEALCAETNAEHAGPSAPSRSGYGPRDTPSYTTIQQHEETLPGPSPSISATDALRRSLSALHTGNFHEPALPISHHVAAISTPGRSPYHLEEGTSSPGWHSPFPNTSVSPTSKISYPEPLRRSRAPSLGSSLSSSFVMRVPTSPLVHAMNNPSLDFSPRDRSTEINKTVRRRTMPPNAFESFHMSPIEDAMPNLQHSAFPIQPELNGTTTPSRHRPRRSLSSFTYQPATSPQNPFLARSRRPSLASDVSPRLRASMVGSFEESILRGRMSTPPSKPFDFVAQIGVVGKGNCPPSLKCPAHVTVPFPAVFYNYPSASESRSISDDNPSPYVGTIDLEHNLRPAEPPTRRTRHSKADLDTEVLATEIPKPENTHIGRALAREGREMKTRLSPTLKVPHGGVYRVPQAGQLQIIIKNPNKTAVKLFLIPYDLNGMLPGTKTFVRQRSFSSGPVLDAALVDKQATPAIQDSLSGKDILRYLVHLKFCCTSKGRFYLYEHIRVVFANRVPDDKEQLRIELQLPDPRFTPYKPPADGSSRSLSVTQESSTQMQLVMAQNEKPQGISASKPPDLGALRESPFDFNFSPEIQTSGEPSTTVGLEEEEEEEDELMGETECTISPVPGFLPSMSARSSPVPWSAPRPSQMVEAGDGLISRKLRALNGASPRNGEQ